MSLSNIIEFRTSSAPLCWAFPALFWVFMASATSQTSSGPVWSQSVQELNHLCVTLLYIGGCFRPPSWTAGFALFFRRRAGTFLWKHATVLLHDQNCHCLAVFILTGCTKQNWEGSHWDSSRQLAGSDCVKNVIELTQNCNLENH